MHLLSGNRVPPRRHHAAGGSRESVARGETDRAEPDRGSRTSGEERQGAAQAQNGHEDGVWGSLLVLGLNLGARGGWRRSCRGRDVMRVVGEKSGSAEARRLHFARQTTARDSGLPNAGPVLSTDRPRGQEKPGRFRKTEADCHGTTYHGTTDRLILSLPTPRSRHSQAACFHQSLLYRSLLHRGSLSRPALFFAGGVWSVAYGPALVRENAP